MPIPILPSLTKESTVAIPKRGEWVSNVQNTLGNLVNSLKVAADSESRISSIPDVWARPILFENILTDEAHPLHGKYLAEWRGILAILALRKIRGFSKLSLYTVELPSLEKLKGYTNKTDEFLKVAARSIPKEYTDKQNDHTLKSDQLAKIQILVYEDTPLAILWPSIIICPSVELEEKRKIDISWWKADGINDPINDLSIEEKKMLGRWLQTLIDTVDDNQLTKLLVEFVHDIEVAVNDDSYDSHEHLMLSTSDSLGITGIASQIDKPIDIQTDEKFLEKSNVLLRHLEGSTAKDLLILSPDIESQWNMNASDIILGGHVTVASILPKIGNGFSNRRKIGDIELDQYNAEIIMADEIFTDAVGVIFLGNNAFPHVSGNRQYEYRGESVNIILPIKEKILEYLEPKYITDNTKISVNNSEITVEFTIPVNGRNGKQFLLTRKVYALDDSEHLDNSKFGKVIEYDTVPVLQIWPNFVLNEAERWKAYYSYYDGCDMSTFYARPKWEATNFRNMQRGLIDAELQKGTTFPKAFVCYELLEDNTGTRYSASLGLSKKEPIELVILLLDPPETKIITKQNRKWKVGVDFGTTNTVAYKSVDGDDIGVIKLESRMYDVCHNYENRLNQGALDTLRKNFISPVTQPNAEENSIKTMFHTYYGKEEGDIREPLFRGHIYYLDDSENIDQDNITESVHTDDMKWGNANGRMNMEAFLMQLSMQCMAEAVYDGASEIEWQYSYPSAFSQDRISKLENSWNNVILPELRKASNRVEIHGAAQAQTESDCIAKYFVSDMNAQINNGIICLDIGGGSTDIAVWQGRDYAIQYQTSIRFAGKTILNNYLWNKKLHDKSPLKILAMGNTNKKFMKLVSSLEETKNKHEFGIKLEAILRYFGDDIIAGLSTNDQDSLVKPLIRDMRFALCGIFFYLGIIIGYLRSQDRYKETKMMPKCFIGGNASKLLDWATPGKYNNNNRIIKEFFKACFLKGVQCYSTFGKEETRGFDVLKTLSPKAEVAFGLVSDKDISSQSSDGLLSDLGFDILDTNVTTVDEYISGEVFTTDAGAPEDTNIITAKDILNIVQVDSIKPKNFMTFVDIYNRAATHFGYDTIELDEEDYIQICGSVNQELVDLANHASGNEMQAEVEPLFIMILRATCEYIALRS